MKNKKNLIIIAIIAVVAIIAAILVITNQPSSYNNTLTADELYDKVKDSFTTNGGIRILDDDVILEFTDKNLDSIESYTVAKATNAKNINEVGIFKVNGNVNEVKKIVTKYLSEKQQSYRAMDYFPEEVEKIDCAKVVVMCNYIIYSFLNEEDTSSFYNAIENLLKQ
jgi:hypothetical protein